MDMSFLKNIKNIQLGLFLCLVLILIGVRNFGVYPMAAGDEFIHYSLSMKNTGILDIPGYIFYDIFSYTGICGSQFYACSKFFNLIVLFLSICVIFYLAKSVGLRTRPAFLLTFISLIAQQSIYASFFSPDAMFGLLYYIFVLYFVVKFIKSEWTTGACIVLGLLIAIASLVKPHGVFFLGFLFLYLFTLRLLKFEGSSYKLSAVAFTLTSVSYFFTRNLFILIKTGSFNLSLFGSSYMQSAPGSFSLSSTTQIIKGLFSVLPNHLAWLFLIYGLPISCMLWALYDVKVQSMLVKKIAIFCLCNILLYVFIVSLFTSTVAFQVGGSETLLRVHTRYYYFIYPVILLFFLLARGDGFVLKIKKVSEKIAAGVAVILYLFIFMFAYYKFQSSLTISLVDNPDIHGFFWIGGISKIVLIMLFILSFLSIILIPLNKKLAFNTYIIFYFLFSMSFFLISTKDLLGATKLNGTWGKYTSCGKILSSIVENDDKYKNYQLWVLGHGVGEAYHTAFQVRKPVNDFIEKNFDYSFLNTKFTDSKNKVLLVDVDPDDGLNVDGEVLFQNQTCRILSKDN